MKKALLYIAYTLAYGFWWVMSLLPLWVLYRLSDLLYYVITYVVRYRHDVIWNNLSTSFQRNQRPNCVRLSTNSTIGSATILSKQSSLCL